jgi:hypothetical protein
MTKENYYVQSGNQNRRISSDSQESAIDEFLSQCVEVRPFPYEVQLGEVIFVSKNPIEPDSSKDAKMYHMEEMATRLGYSIQKGEDDEGPKLTVFNG